MAMYVVIAIVLVMRGSDVRPGDDVSKTRFVLTHCAGKLGSNWRINVFQRSTLDRRLEV